MKRAEAVAAFRNRFGEEPEWVAFAPGRVNLIGEHTDYTGGFVLPAALPLGLTIAARRSLQKAEVWSADLGEGETFAAENVKPGDVSGWASYAAGVAWARGGAHSLRAAVVSDLPMESGVSSSAALEVGFALLYDAASGTKRSATETAQIGQRAENDFVGVRCGIMDQLASAAGRAGHCLLIDTRDLTVAPVPIPETVRIVLCATGVPRALAESAYNKRREELEEAEQQLGKSLREVAPEELPHPSPGEPLWAKRARHVVTENRRVLAMTEALRRQDRDAVFDLMKSAHVSMRDDFEASSEAQDAMVEACWRSPGVWGARLTGGGFGGACVALVEEAEVQRFCVKAEQLFRSLVKGTRPDFQACLPGDGASVVHV